MTPANLNGGNGAASRIESKQFKCEISIVIKANSQAAAWIILAKDKHFWQKIQKIQV